MFEKRLVPWRGFRFMNGRVGLLTAMLLATALSGCFGFGEGDAGKPQETPGPTGGGGANVTQLTVRILDYDRNGTVGDPINVTWEVSSNLNRTAPLTHTGVHFGNASLPDPNRTSDEEYEDSAGERSGVPPGRFNASFSVNASGTYYVRAHAELGTNYSWSQEVSLALEEGGKTWTVRIVGGPLAFLARFEPESLQARVGDQVVWKNEDDTEHTATADDASFNTGNILGGSMSDPVVLTKEGTIPYHCGIHPDTMQGEIIVGP